MFFKRPREKSPYFLVAMDFGYTLLAGVGVFGFLGWKLDERYLTSPWYLLGGIGLGLAVGFNSLFRRLNYLEKGHKLAKQRQKEQERERNKDPEPR